MKELKQKIVFESFSDFSDNTRTLFDYLVSNQMNKKYEMVWLVENPEKFKNIAIENVVFSYVQPQNEYEYEHMKRNIEDAKFLIGSNRNIKKFDKRQIYLNLWHGTLLKKLNDYKIDNSDWDFLLCPSEFFADIYQRELHISKEKLIYFNNTRNDDLWIKDNSLGTLYPNQKFKKFILWMPTYRQHRTGSNVDSTREFTLGIPIFNNIEELNEMDKLLQKEDTLLMLKVHPAQDLSKIKINSMKNIKIVKNDELEEKNLKLYNLIAESDALITDYSSVYFDYMILDRPIGFTIDDFKEYKGYVFEEPLEYMPGTHIDNYKNLKNFILEVLKGKDKYKEKRRKLNKIFNKYSDNKNSERITEFLKL